ncbi:hypothetical protein SAMD00019534_067300 [Acytostelium subglobosum LB1]|uniref:hypothetical protein n=1 Tax=Acytostelium subglobosum LB1 TaxID=1410327 RepID=UPI000644B502|nr:hypothetical protein SAMD00019534_067300 [Acytostelium subglobosum LB1]GAM23555.1 hypothetical protein SAMD00019534_067300 [Acytostelium subglobosum LB1]|eukprot:XP_012753296.1 hypothetical protein SAMD00019534_067300 [Acytostelium subglobosum LB1]
MVYAACKDSAIRVWNVNNGQKMDTLSSHSGSVRALEVKGHHLISAGDDKVVRVWDVHRAQVITSLRSHQQSINSILVGHGVIISSSLDQTTRVWDLRTPRPVHTFESDSSVTCLALDRRRVPTWDDGNIASGLNNGYIDLWCMKTGSMIASTKEPLLCPVHHIEYMNNSIYTSDYNDVLSWDLNDTSPSRGTRPFHMMTPNRVFRGHQKAINNLQIKASCAINHIDLSKDRLVSSSEDGSIRVWNYSNSVEVINKEE